MSIDDLYKVNDALCELAYQFGTELDDATLNDLTHTVAKALGVEES